LVVNGFSKKCPGAPSVQEHAASLA
jgi:hypothetical protein